jgi:TonB-linked SusC/RagA family outer membrane protein
MHLRTLFGIPPISGSIKKTLRIFKLTVFILFTACLSASAVGGKAQNITFSATNVTLKRVFAEIKKQSDYTVFYNYEILEDAKKVTIHVVDATVEQVLNVALRGQNLTYVIEDKMVGIYKKDPEKQQTMLNLPPPPPPPINITGQVRNEKDEPVSGASVMIKGSGNGTTTNTDGDFSLNNVSSTATLVISLIGYEVQEVPVNNRTTINVKLQLSAIKLDEVVVTAFGISKEKKGLVYSVQSVKGSEFTEAREVNVANALTGKIAGVDATQVSSGPGGSSRVVIRGNGSFNSNQQPLYVVNGMPIISDNSGAATNTTGFNADRGDGISSINPDDIESIEVLKSGAAAALYGSQAANGVILITTKSGKAQQGIGVEYSTNYVVGTPTAYPNFQTEYGSGNDGVKPATQAAALSAGRLSYGAKVDGSQVIQFDGVERPYSPVGVKNNINHFYRPSQDFVNTIALTGGSKELNFRLSLSNLKSLAQTPNSSFDRKVANLALRSKLGKNDLIELEANVQYNLETGKNRPTVGYAEINSSWATYLLGSTVDIRSLAPGYDANGNEIQWNPVPAAPNPWFIVNKMGNKDDKKRFIGSGSAKINILKNLYLKGTVAQDYQNVDMMDFVPMGTAFTPKGYLDLASRQATRTNMNLILNYNTEFLKNFGVNAFVGSNRERISNLGSNLRGIDFIIPDFISYTNLKTINPSSTTWPYRSELRSGTNSVFGSADLNYKSVVFLSVTGRQDWFSTLNRGHNSIFYPSIGTGIILSDIVTMPAAINFLKLRASWAQVGSSTVAPESINRIYTSIPGGFNGIPVQTAPNNLQNPDIRPLTVTTTEGGFELQLLQNRLSVDATYYSRVTTNDILQPAISATSGYLAGNQNVGKITNKGIELLITGRPIRTENFSWTSSFNFAYNKSEIVELAPGITNLTIGTGISSGVSIVNAVGLPYGSVLGWKMKKDANGVQVYNATSGYEDRYQDYLGVANPPYTMGFSNTFTYKRFTMNVLLDAKFGAVAFNNMWIYAMRFGLTKNTLPGRETGVQLDGVDQDGNKFSKLWPVVDLDTYYNNLGANYSERATFKTDFVKLRSFILDYSIPVRKIKFVKLQSLSIGFVARNLAILYRDKKVKDAGLDPEMQQTVANATGTAGAGEPRTRTMGVNLNIKF